MAELELRAEQRMEVLDRLYHIVVDRFYDPQLRGINWKNAVERNHDAIVSARSAEEFERGVTRLLGELRTSHVGFYHHRLARATSKMAISATYAAFSFEQEQRWVFQDVHEGGAAHVAGIRPGDILVSVDGRSFRPDDHPVFPMNSTVPVEVLTKGCRSEIRNVVTPPPTRKRKQLPFAQPTLVSQRRLSSEIGYLKITMYPGMVGVEIANEILAAVQSLNPIARLIVDLRGNTGGGIGVLRLMSLLTPEQLSVGYSVDRKQMDRLIFRNRFPVFNRIPSRKAGLIPLAFKFTQRKDPILLATEGLGPQPFHNRVVLLVNRHTASANEMLVAFAKENGLAAIVGEATPGRLLAGSKFKLPYGYRVALPVGVYHTAAGYVLEGTPIEPDYPVPFDPEQAREGKDPQLEAAIEVVSSL
jgi:C-terminal processing protease CtpA/Prc